MIWFPKVDMNSKLIKLTINLVTFQKLSPLNFFSRCSLILTSPALLSEDMKWFSSAETSLGVSWVPEASALLANRAEREPSSIPTIPRSTQSPQKDQDKAFTRRTSPPPERPAANVMNASVNTTHSPSHRTACSQSAIWGWNGPHSTKLRTTFDPKGRELLETVASLRMTSERVAPPPPTPPHHVREEKKTHSGAENRN